MALPTINDVQLVEPVLTNMLVAYRQSADRFVASRAFPAVSVGSDSGTYPKLTTRSRTRTGPTRRFLWSRSGSGWSCWGRSR